MGDFKYEFCAVGGHGCDRTAKEGDELKPCGSESCPDCFFLEVTKKAKAKFSMYIAPGSPNGATFTHWPTTTPIVDDYSDPEHPKRKTFDFQTTPEQRAERAAPTLTQAVPSEPPTNAASGR